MKYLCRVFLTLSVSALPSCRGGSGNLSKEIGDLGYQELRPPTTLTPPGTIVVVRSTDPIEVAVICTQNEVVKSESVVKSKTKSVMFEEKTRTTLSVGAEYLSAYGIDVKASHIDSVSMTLSGAEVFEIPDSAIAATLSTVDANCKQAIKVRLENQRSIGLVKSVLKANVIYTVKFDDTVDLSAKATLMPQLAVKLGGGVASTVASTIKGEELFWGIITDTDFFSSWPDLPPVLETGQIPVLVPGGAPIFRIDPKGFDDAHPL